MQINLEAKIFPEINICMSTQIKRKQHNNNNNNYKKKLKKHNKSPVIVVVAVTVEAEVL